MTGSCERRDVLQNGYIELETFHGLSSPLFPLPTLSNWSHFLIAKTPIDHTPSMLVFLT